MVSFSRKIILLISFLITAVLFIAGFYAGILFDSSRTDDANNLIINTQLDADSFIIERDFFNTFGSTDCSILNQRMSDMNERLGEIGRTLARYDYKKMSYGNLYDQLKRKYFLLEINTYILKKQLISICSDKSPVILFFYDTANNQESLNQGYVLDTIVKKNKNITIFSFDRSFQDLAVLSLVKYYNVAKAPAIVLNFNNTYARFVSENELMNIINNN